MFGTALIVFREALEAALIIGIVSASTRDIPGRTRYVWAGVGLGILGSIVVAGMAEAISAFAQGMGQEIFNASVLGFAVVMLAWQHIWMFSHGRKIEGAANDVGWAVDW